MGAKGREGAMAKGDEATARTRASLVYLLAGIGWAAAHALGLLGPLAGATFGLIGISAVVATVVGVRRYRPAVRWQWAAIATALVLFLVGGAARIGLETLGDLSSGRSLVPDVITLPGYLILAAGLTGLARARDRDVAGQIDALLDAALAALAALTLGWVFFINPVLFGERAPMPVRLLLAAYPPMSVFLVAIAARLAFGRNVRRAPAHAYLLVAMSFMLVGDIAYMLADARLAELPLGLIDLPYALAYVGYGACVLHPSMQQLCRPLAAEGVAPTRPRLAAVALAFAIPAIVTVSRQSWHLGDRVALGGIILVLTALAIWRVLRALHAHAAAEARLVHQATHDALTHLPNRLLVQEHVTKALRRAAAADRRLALLFLDIDHFKLVNDTMGHSVGDDLLMAVAERLKDNVRSHDFVARVGGDEFVVVLDDVNEVGEAMYAAEAIRCCFHAPFLVRDSEIYSSASIGVTLTSGHDLSVTAETLIREADTAMYQAKAGGRDEVAVFDASMRDRVAERLALENELRHAVELGQLELHFQPVVRMPGGVVEGLEALLRWTHPELGQVPPAKFIPVAEDSGLIMEIGIWVLREACREVARWRRELPTAGSLHVAVNLSARQLRDPGLVDAVQDALLEHDLPPAALCLELTESLLMENPTAAAELLGSLHSLGVRLSIDDFGTGYSSLAHLKRFPVDHVKIDRAFVEGLQDEDSSDESLVVAIIAMARALGMATIAEGVETTEQHQRLVALGCDFAQGYLFSRPVPAAEVPEKALGLSLDAPLVGVSRGS